MTNKKIPSVLPTLDDYRKAGSEIAVSKRAREQGVMLETEIDEQSLRDSITLRRRFA